VYYPRSFLKFILLGFLLVASRSFMRWSSSSFRSIGCRWKAEAVQQAAQAGRASRQLFEQSTTLERIVRQYLILEDGALLDDYGRMRQEFRTTTRQLALLPLSSDQLAALEGLGASEARLNQLLRISPRPPDAHTQLAEGYSKLADGAQSLLGATND
jgi:two-component system sensor histidine kinase GlrK